MSSSYDLINKLPDELLREILLWHNATEHVSVNAKLKLVCKRWNYQVTSTPLLWNSIQLFLGNTVPDLERWCRLVEVCIEASGKAPLDIVLDFAQVPDGDNVMLLKYFAPDLPEDADYDIAFDLYKDLLVDVTALLAAETLEVRKAAEDNGGVEVVTHISHMERWRSFGVEFGDRMLEGDIQAILSVLCHPTPMLETLDIQFEAISTREIGVDFTFPEESFPNLQNLTTFFTNAAIDLSQFLRRGDALQTLSFEVTPMSFACLPNFSGLHTLHLFLNVDPEGDDREVPSDPITLPRLKNLTLPDNCKGEMISLILAPNLRYLRLESLDYAIHAKQSPLLNSIHSLEWTISIRWEDDNAMFEALSTILSQCHQLVEFTTWAANGDDVDHSVPDRTKTMVRQILTNSPLETLETITYMCPCADNDFDNSDISEVVKLPFPKIDLL